MSMSSSGPVMNPGAMGIYNQQLSTAMGRYGTIMGLMNTNQANAQKQYDSINAGYANLGAGIKDQTMGLYNQSALDTKDAISTTLGRMQSGAAGAGFTSSAQLALQNQAAALAARDYGKNAANFAELGGQQMRDVGMAGLSARQGQVGSLLGYSQGMSGILGGLNLNPNVNLYGQHSYSTGGGGGGGGGGLGGYGPSPGGASSAVGATGAYGFGSTGLGNNYSSALGYQQPSYGSYGGSGGYGSPIYDYTPGSRNLPFETGIDLSGNGDLGGGGDF